MHRATWCPPKVLFQLVTRMQPVLADGCSGILLCYFMSSTGCGGEQLTNMWFGRFVSGRDKCYLSRCYVVEQQLWGRWNLTLNSLQTIIKFKLCPLNLSYFDWFPWQATVATAPWKYRVKRQEQIISGFLFRHINIFVSKKFYF